MRYLPFLPSILLVIFLTGPWLHGADPVVTVPGEASIRVAKDATYTEVTATATDAEDGAIAEITVTYSHPSWLTRKEDMVAWWEFENDATDSSGNGNDGELTGAASYAGGKFGQAVDLPHDGSHVLVNNFNGVPVGDVFSISAWILPNDITSGGNSDGAIFSTNNTILFWVNFDAASGSGPASPTFLAGSTANNERVNGPANALHALDWQHVMAVMEGKTRRLYVDGALVATQTNGLTAARNIQGQTVQLGAWGTSANMYFDGKIDDVRVYDVALEDADATAIYGTDGAGDLGGDALDSSLLGLWTVTYSATDADGNVGIATRTVEVYDPSAPVIQLAGELQMRVEQGTDFVEPGYTILDSEGGDAINGAEATVTTTMDTDLAGVYLLYYDYTDGDGLAAATVVREVTVSDTGDPTISLHQAASIQHPLGEPFIDPGASGQDDTDGELAAVSSLWTSDQLIHRGFTPGWPEQELNFHNNGGLLAATPRGEYFLKSGLKFSNDADFRATAAGIPGNDNFRNLFLGWFKANKAGEYEFGISQEDDRATIWLDLDQDGVFEMDGRAGNEWLNRSYNVGYGTVTLQPGIYRFAAGHLEGGGGSSIQATIQTPPGAGPATRTLIDPSAPGQAGLWLTESPLDTSVPGTHTITYTVTDGGGNSVSTTRTVEVKVLAAQPTITLLDRPILNHSAGSDFTDPGVTLTSAAGESLDASLVNTSGSVDSSRPGEYTLTYWFYDENGIPADRVSRIVKVADTTPPTLTLQGDAEIEHILGQPFTDPGVTVTDNVDTGLVAGSTEKLPTQNLWMHLDASNIPGVSPGDPIIQWTDISGNGNHLSDVRGEPQLVDDALNGRPAIRVDGDDFLAATTQVQRHYSIFTVSKLEGSVNGKLLSSKDVNWFLGYGGNFQDHFHPEGYVSYFHSQPATIEPHLYSATSTGANHVRFFSNGREIIEDYYRNGRIGMFQIGGYQHSTESAAGDVAEVLIYDAYVVTEAERLSIEALLSLKYQFPGYPAHTPPDLSQLGEHEILYIAQDSSGNLGFATRKVTVVPDPSLPVIVLLGDVEMTVEAGSTFTDPGTKIVDPDGNDVQGETATPASTIDTSVLGIQTLTFNYSEPGADALPVERKVIVVDTLPPVLTLTGDTDIRLKVGETLDDPGVSATDQYEGDVSVHIDNPSPAGGYIPGLLGGGLWEYTNFDPNPGNLGVDPIGPSLAYVLDLGPNWKEYWTAVYTGQIYDEDGKIGFYENINNHAILTVGGVKLLDNSTHNEVTTKSHDFGQGGWFDFELRMGNAGGMGGMTGNIGFGISQEDDGNYVQAKNSDANTMDLFRVLDVVPSIFDATTPGTFTITYTATDAHGNSATATRNIVVVEDDTLPYIVLNGEAEMTLEATSGATFTDPKADAKDGDGNIIASDIMGEGAVDPTTPGTYQLVYRHTHTGTDLKPVGRTIYVVDTTPPVITLAGDSLVKVFVNGIYTEAGATAADALDGQVTVHNDIDPIPDALLHTVFHNIHVNELLDFDLDGGLLSMEPDATALMRHGYQGKGLHILWDDEFRATHPGLLSNDNYQNLFHGTFTALREGEYEFQCADINNAATIWLDKDQDGLFERLGEAGDERLVWADFATVNTTVYLTKGTYRVAIAHSEGGGDSILIARFRAPGGAGPDVLSDIIPAADNQTGVWATLPNPIDTSTPGHFKVTYFSQDASGNRSSVSRTVVVEEDLERPVITLLGPDTYQHEAGQPFTGPGYLLDDYQGNALDETQVVITGAPDGQEPGTFTLSYKFTDAGGHVADTRTRTVIVTDTTPPVITLLGTNPTIVQLGQPFHDPGAIAVDALDGVVPVVETSSIIPDGLLLHLDATTFLATHQDGETITGQWPDISGQGNHADNIAGDPVFVQTGTHGQPAVNFDGDDLIWTTTDFESLLPNYTIFGVARYTGGDSERIFSTRGRNWLFAFHTGNTGRFYAEGWVSTPTGGDTNWHHHTVTANTRDQATLWRNNTILVQDHGGMNNTNYRPRVLQLGGYDAATQVSECEVSELLVYNRVLSMFEISLTQSHLDNKYNLNGGSDFSFNIDTSQVGERNISYLASDSSGHIAEVHRTVKVVDEPDLPVILLAGDAAVTHSAGEPYEDAGASIQNAQNGETPVLSGSVDILKTGTYTLAYDFTDGSGNSAATVVRTVTVIDQTPPVIHLVGGDTIEHQLGNPFSDPGFSATDAVDGEVLVQSSALTKDTLRAKGFMLSNSNTHLQLADEGGLLAETPAGSTTFQSGANNLGVYFDSDWIFRALVPEITRNDNFQFLIEGHFHTSTGGRYEFGIEYPDDRAGFWFDVDNDGNFETNGDFGPEIMNSEWIYGYRQVDLAPGFYRFAIAHREGSGSSRIDARYRAISGVGPATLTRIFPGQDFQEGQWVLYDPINVLAPGEHTITYTARDFVGNEATVTRTVLVRNNPEAAVLTLLGDAEMTLPFGGTFTDPGVSITDLDGNAIAGAQAEVVGEVDTSRPARYILEYRYTNAAGFPARIVTRKVFVVDQTPPVITLEGDAEITIAQGSAFVDPGATALDDFDGNLPVGSSEAIPADGLLLHLDASQILGKSDGDPILSWLDTSGNSNDAHLPNGTPTYVANSLNGRPGVHFDGLSRLATSNSFGNTYSIITVSQLTGGSNQRLLSSLDTDWALGYDNGFEDVFDMVNGLATDQLSPATTNPHIYSATGGGRQVRFFADGEDKTVYPLRRDDRYNIGKFQMGANLGGTNPSEGDVHEVMLYDRVLGDTDRMSIEARLNAKYSLNGVTGVESPVDTKRLGTYHVVYQAIDGAGNLATATRTVIVAPDPEAPVITLLGEPFVTLEAGEAYNDAGATLQDKEGNAMDSSLITVDNPVDITVPGLYTITFSYAPQFEVPATEVTRDVIVQDTQPPTITLAGDKVMKLGVGETYTEPGFTATDNASGDIPVFHDLSWTFGRIDRVGFMKDNATFGDLDLDGNGGLLSMTPVGFSFVSTGPGGRGFDFDNAGDFWVSMVDADGNPQPGRNDQFQILYTAYFFARTPGVYEFGVPDLDGENQIWLDRDRDGTFESTGDLGSELILANRGTGAVTLEEGYYRFAIAYREGTNLERLEVVYSKPVSDGVFSGERIHPADPAQTMDWAVPIPSPLDTSTPGTYTITYHARDIAGHTATNTRTVVVVADTSLPFIAINGELEMIHEAGESFEDPEAVVTDDSGVLDDDLLGEGTVDPNTPGEYTLTYKYTNAVDVVRKVIVADTTPPTVTLKPHPTFGGADTVTFTVGNTWEDPGVDTQDHDTNPRVINNRDWNPNRLFHAGFAVPWNTGNINFENDGGFLSFQPSGTAEFTSGAFGRGWDYRSHSDFLAEPIGLSAHNNQGYGDYITGYFHARVDGDYLFATDLPGGNAAITIWLDLDEDGQFSRSGLSGDERLTSGTQTQTVFLNEGYYRFIGGHGEGSTDSSGRMRFLTPEGAGPSDELTVIHPADPAQFGLWNLKGEGAIDTNYPGAHTITYYVIDASGNLTTATRTVVIEEDPAAPVLTLVGGAVIHHQIGTTYEDDLPTIAQADGTPINDQVNITTTGHVFSSTAGTYELQYNYTDGSNRKAIPLDRTIIVGDHLPPVITILGDNPFQLSPGFPYTDEGATAEDSIDGPVTVTTSGDNFDTAAEATFTITYTATDAAGNTSTATRNVIIKDDPNRPIIHLTGGDTLTHEAGQPFTDPGHSVSNARGTTYTEPVVITGDSVDHTTLGTYSIIYNFTATDGKTAPTAIRTVTVVDTTPPDLQLTGGSQIRVARNSDYTDPGFTVTDNLDTDPPVTVLFEASGTQPVAQWDFNESDGTIAKDLQGGLNATLVNFPDPVADSWVDVGKYGNALSFNSGNSSYLTVPGSDKLDLQAFTISVWIKTDDYNRNMFIFEKTTDGTLNSQYNLYFEDPNTLFFRLNDGSGGFESQTLGTAGTFIPDTWEHLVVVYDGAVQKLYIDNELEAEVQQDITIPATPAAGPAFIGAYAQGGGYHFHGLMDDLKIYDQEIPVTQIPEIAKATGVDTSEDRKSPPYKFTYTSTDTSGNTVTLQREVVVSNDNVPPTITLIGDSNLEIDTGTDFQDPGASANDLIDGILTPFITVSGSVDTTKAGTYTLTYNVSDLSFNAADPVTRTVVVSDPSDPLDAWTQNYLSTLPPDKQTPLADPDHDRVPNLLEYAIGGNPNNPDRKSTLPEVNKDSGSLTITFLRIKQSVDPTLTYTVELTRKLKGGTWSEADVTVTVDADQSGVPPDYEKVTATANTPIANETQGRQFIRITVDRP